MIDQCAGEVNDFWSSIFWITAHGPKDPVDELYTWGFWIKTLAPAIITAGLATLTYFVARNQRTIARNKYNLDLFDRRMEQYINFTKEYNLLDTDRFINLPEDIKEISFPLEDCIDVTPIENTLFICSCLFDKKDAKGNESPIIDLQKKIEHIKQERTKIAGLEDAIDHPLSPTKPEYKKYKSFNEMEREIIASQQKIRSIEITLDESYSRCITFMQKVLQISFKPY